MYVIYIASCACNQSESELTLCSGATTSPCNCTITQDCEVSRPAQHNSNYALNYVLSYSLQCQMPFIGNNVWCTLDSDGDGYPDIPLPPFICNDPEELSMNYCMMVLQLLCFSNAGLLYNSSIIIIHTCRIHVPPYQILTRTQKTVHNVHVRPCMYFATFGA